MRNVVASFLLLGALAVAGCFNPSVPDNRFTCTTTDSECPNGLSCINGFCTQPGDVTPVKGVVVTITKTGSPYSGPTQMLNWTDASMCPDEAEEPNDGPDPYGQPLTWIPKVDNPTPPTIAGKAICPTGPNPATSNHDVDFYKIDETNAPAAVTLVANVTYDIQYGDLDIAVYDSKLNQLIADGTAVSNGCVATTLNPGQVYYVVVAGANNMDINNFSIQMATWSTPHACDGSTSP